MHHHIVRHVKRRRRTYIEIAVCLAVIFGFFLLYKNQEANFEAYLAEKFPSPGLRLAEVVKVEDAPSDGTQYLTQDVTVRLLTGADKGEETVVTDRILSASSANSYLKLTPGERVLLAKNTEFTNDAYYIVDRYRLPSLLFAILIFIIVAALLGRKRGFTAMIGLAASVGVLGWFVIPKILAGNDPLLITLSGAAMIAFVSLFLAHGFNKRTAVALGGTLIALAISACFSVLFVSLTRLIGLATDESFYLAVGQNANLNLRGLLLGGIILGTLGVLDDATMSQSATVYELKAANAALDFSELYRRGMAVGREHIASLVNTLFLAYAGVALPTILYLVAFQSQLPLWMTLNGEPIAEEIIRTVVGGIGIILAVPITTLLAAWVFGKKDEKEKPHDMHEAASN